MKRLALLLLLAWACTAVTGRAQVRSYSDNASKTYIVGLDNYFYGDPGALVFDLDGREVRAAVEGGTVSVDGTTLLQGRQGWETIIGIHDFTGNRAPELVVARRSENALEMGIYPYSGGRWKEIGSIGSSREGVSDIRVFRQVISFRKGDALHSWTWRENGFEHKSSDGSTPE